MLRHLAIVAGIATVFLAGTAVHEATHAVAVHAVGGRIDHIHWFPPNASVVFEAPDATARDLVRIVPIGLSLPLLVGAMLTLQERSFSLQVAGGVFVAGFVPAPGQGSDWHALAALLGRTLK